MCVLTQPLFTGLRVRCVRSDCSVGFIGKRCVYTRKETGIMAAF